MAITQDEVINYLSNLTVIDLVNLTKALEDKWGVKAAPVAVAAAGGAGGAAPAAAPVEEKTEFTVILKGGGTNKIGVIKVVREITGVGLADGKNLVDGAPKPIKENIPKEEAEAVKKKLEEAGGKVTIK